MSTFVVEGGHRLEGTIYPQGAKNEALEVICAVLLTPERVVIENIPDILDVRNRFWRRWEWRHDISTGIPASLRLRI